MRAQGLLAQCTDEAALIEHLQGERRTLYCGFDPTADSLHIGNLVPLLALRRFQMAGHRPVVLVGGATGMIGDPSGRSDERNLTDTDTVLAWTARLRAQMEPFFDFDGPAAAIMANNHDWAASMDLVSYLRDIGKHFSVNAMIQRESVKNRLDRDGEGISYTEFSYMVLQAMDYLHLAREHGCSLQIGGSDQWGNIVSGVDLIRRVLGRTAFAATFPLVTKADGTKFGKTAGGAIWLDAKKTSPYSFYQFWVNTADADVPAFLRTFTFLSSEAIAGLERELTEQPQRREAQKTLASEVTRLVHGEDALAGTRRITDALFAGELNALTEADLGQLALDGMESSRIMGPTGLLSAMVSAGLAPSNGAARKLVASGGVSINGEKAQDPAMTLAADQALYGRYHILRRGKKAYHLLVGEG
ncbi:MAG: tyrosine--tRNA ligase [Pseudomonadota bacterium]